jgi:hypothetical protein
MLVRAETCLPVEVVFHPSWWHSHEGIVFDRDFFFHPAKRVEEELHMERALYERWGGYGLGAWRDRPRPVLGPVHLAAGFLVSGMLGCGIAFQPGGSPQVLPAGRPLSAPDLEAAFASPWFHDFRSLADSLKSRFGYLAGDADWNGILNIALDLYGQELFLEMADHPDAVKEFFRGIAAVAERFFRYVHALTGSTSIAVNRTLLQFADPILLHSHCSHTMVGEAHYREFLLPFDIRWADRYPPYGIHYCGPDPQRFLAAYREIPGLAFLDVGWGGDLQAIRAALPETFLNIRLSPAEIVRQTPAEIEAVILERVEAAGDPCRTGVCCINIDDTAAEEQISAIFETVKKIRGKVSKEAT